jgi:serine/threonine-protein kinase
LRDIGDARAEIDEIVAGVGGDVTAPPRRMAARLLPWAVTTVFGVALASMFVLWTSSRSTFSAAPVTFAILSAVDQPLVPNNNDRQFDLSPDGTRIVYASGASNTGGPIAVRNLGQLQPVTLLGITSGRAPFFSADGQWVGFFDLAAVAFKKTPTTGGPVITVCRLAAAPRGVVWGPDDTIVFATSDPSTGLLSVAASGGEPVVLTKANSGQGESDHVFPSLLPDGRTVVFTVTGQKRIDDAIAVLNRDTGTWKTVIHGGSNARYVDSGHLVYTSGTTLFAVRFDPVRLQVESTPAPIIDALAIAPTTGAAQYSISQTGTLAYMPPSGAFAEVRSVVWVDRTGREEHLNVPPRAYWTARLSPDGNRVALNIRELSAPDADTSDVRSGTRFRTPVDARWPPHRYWRQRRAVLAPRRWKWYGGTADER